MTLFVGGPYDGKDLPVDPELTREIRLPPENEMHDYLGQTESDPGATGKQDWPFLYKLDETGPTACFRYIETDG